MAGDGSKAPAEQGAHFHMAKGRSGLGLESHLCRGRGDLVPSWGPPALPPEPWQEQQGTLLEFVVLFLSYHVPVTDFPLLVAPCAGGPMLTSVPQLPSGIMPGESRMWCSHGHRSLAAWFKTRLQLILASPS